MIETLTDIVAELGTVLLISAGITVFCWIVYSLVHPPSQESPSSSTRQPLQQKPPTERHNSEITGWRGNVVYGSYADADEMTDTGMTYSELTAYLAAEKERYGQ